MEWCQLYSCLKFSQRIEQPSMSTFTNFSIDLIQTFRDDNSKNSICTFIRKVNNRSTKVRGNDLSARNLAIPTPLPFLVNTIAPDPIAKTEQAHSSLSIHSYTRSILAYSSKRWSGLLPASTHVRLMQPLAQPCPVYWRLDRAPFCICSIQTPCSVSNTKL